MERIRDGSKINANMVKKDKLREIKKFKLE